MLGTPGHRGHRFLKVFSCECFMRGTFKNGCPWCLGVLCIIELLLFVADFSAQFVMPCGLFCGLFADFSQVKNLTKVWSANFSYIFLLKYFLLKYFYIFY